MPGLCWTGGRLEELELEELEELELGKLELEEMELEDAGDRLIGADVTIEELDCAVISLPVGDVASPLAEASLTTILCSSITL